MTRITDLRSVWPHEANDFTKWLAKEENLALLSDAIDIELELEGYRVTSIRTDFPGGYNNPEDEWPAIIAEDLERTKRFISAFKGPVSKLK